MDTHYDIIRVDEVASTQDLASSLRDASGQPTLVIAERQTRGRGRSGRSWIEPDRALFSSFSFRPAATEGTWGDSDLPLVPLITAVAVRRAISSIGGPTVDCKWPNDLMVDGRKVGGILVEGTGDVVTVGCGVNLAWDDPPSFATSIDLEGHGDMAGELAVGWVDALLGLIGAGPSMWPIGEYRRSCTTLGRVVRWEGGIGVAQDVDPSGALVVIDGEDQHRVLSGDVHLLGES